MRWRFFYVPVSLILILFAILTWRFGPAASVALGLAAPASETWFSRLSTLPSREGIDIPSPSGTLQADLYRPARPRGSLVLVHGLSRLGRRQPDLERLARLLARQGLVVVVPQFEGLAAFRLTGREVDDIRASLQHTATLSGAGGVAANGSRRGDAADVSGSESYPPDGQRPLGPISVAGFSFGAGPALIAAAGVPNLRVVGSFGGYADLVNVITYVTTGVHAFDGRRYVQRQEEYNRWKLLALLVELVTDSRQRALLDGIAQRKVANPGEDTTTLEQALGPEGSAVLALVVNRREDRVAALVADLPAGTGEALRRLSPLAALPHIRGRLLIAHGLADDSIPYTESLRVAAAAGDRARLALFETFHHTGPRSLWPSLAARVGDGWMLVGVVDELLPR